MVPVNESILKAALFTLTPEGFWGLPVLNWGDPGTGKTSMWEALARAFGFNYFRFSPAEKGHAAFGVVPVPGADGRLHYPAPSYVDTVGDRAVIHLDEINTADRDMQSPLLGFVQLRVVGDHQFGPGVRVVGSANETIDAAGGWDLPNSLTNRFGHFHFAGKPAHEWADGLLTGFRNNEENVMDAAAEEKRVQAAWPEAISEARAIIAAFISSNPTVLHQKPKLGSGERVWPSRRTCEYATCALAASRVHDLSEADTHAFMSAFVGLSWVRQFLSFSHNKDLPKSMDVLTGKVKFKHDANRLDRTVIVLSGCAGLLKETSRETTEGKTLRKNGGNTLWRLIGEIGRENAECVIPAVRVLARNQMGLGFCKEADAVLNDLTDVVNAAGL